MTTPPFGRALQLEKSLKPDAQHLNYKHLQKLMAKLNIKIKEKIQKLSGFLTLGVWELPLKKMPSYNRAGIHIVRVILLAAKGYQKDECPVRASALTYFTVLSIVPMIAFVFAISKGFGLEQILEDEISNSLASQQEIMTYLLDFSKRMLASTKSGVLAVISIGILLYTVLKLFHHIESTLNIIWKVKKSRTLLRKFTDYLAIVIIAPILMIGSSASTVYINTTLKSISNTAIFDVIPAILIIIMKTSPFVIMWILFTGMYLIIPNTKVKLGHAFVAGIIAGSLFQLVQIYYIDLQFAFSRYNAVYGSFAALPLFLFWVQFSWLVFLFGAEISSALNKVGSYGYKLDYEMLSNSRKRLLNFLVLRQIVECFKDGNDAPSMQQLTDKLKLPVRYIEQITDNLVRCNLINEIVSHEGVPNAFQPAKDIASLSFASVYSQMENVGENRLIIHESPEFDKMNAKFDEFYELIDKNYSGFLIKDM